MAYSTEQIIIFLASLPALLVSTVLGGLRINRTTPALRLLCLLIFFTFLTELVSRTLWLTRTPNLFLWPIYMAAEFGFLLWLYSLILNSALLVRTRLWLLLGFVGLLVWQQLVRSDRVLINNVGRMVESGLVIGLTLAFFYQTFRELRVQRLEQEPLFWVSSGLLLFFSGSLFVFIFANFGLQYSQKLNYQMWMIHAVLNAFLYSAYSYALWISPKK